MLNGAHSLLAYCGLKAGHAYVHQAVADPDLLSLTGQLLRQEATPTIAAGEGQDLAAYADQLLDRFANPALNHRLIQIAMDGSQKIPQRWLETLAANAREMRQCPAILRGIAAWIEHLRGANGPVDDPLADRLAAAAASDQPALALLGDRGLIASDWRPTAADLALIASHLG
jgi:fructuronate reductase